MNPPGLTKVSLFSLLFTHTFDLALGDLQPNRGVDFLPLVKISRPYLGPFPYILTRAHTLLRFSSSSCKTKNPGGFNPALLSQWLTLS